MPGAWEAVSQPAAGAIGPAAALARPDPAYPAHFAGCRQNRRGFTLVELLLALVLTGVVSASVYRWLVGNQRTYARQAERVELNANLRAAMALLPAELAELATTDTVDSDILELADTALAYKAIRNLYFLCQPPLDEGTSGRVTLWGAPVHGLRPVEPDRDSAVIFAEADPDSSSDDYFVHANVDATTLGVACPGGAPSVSVSVSSVYPPGGLSAVQTGAPFRSFELVRLLTYRDVYGDWWLGIRQYTKGNGWATVQPVLGPLAPGGFRLSYHDDTGAPTADRTRVARIGVQLIGQSLYRVWTSTGALSFLVDTLTTQVALRNVRRE